MKKFFKQALALSLLAVFASCATDDAIIGDSDGIVKKSETRYLSVSLSSANGVPDMRAIGDLDATDGEYADGTAAENKIKTVEFYFYDKDKQFHSYYSLPLDSITDPINVNNTAKPNVDALYHCNVPVELVQGELYPQYVLCILNSVEGTAYRDKPMELAQKKILSDIYAAHSSTEGGKYFGMSNSVYYGHDDYTNKPNELIMATPFKLDALKTSTEISSMSPAELEASSINIYVERYAAKVNLDISGVTPVDYTTGNAGNVQLVFKPSGWGVNCIEKKFFFLKAFRTIANSQDVNLLDGTGVGVDFEQYADLDFLFKGWNNEAHHRSFWARSPGYYQDSYPIVADDINDNPENDYQVHYLDYNECVKDTIKEGNEAGKPFSKYVMETTMKKSRLTGDDMPENYLPLASIPSVILTGNYRVKGHENVEADLYAYGVKGDSIDGKYVEKYVFYANDTDTTTLGLSSIKDRMMNDQTIILKQNKVTDEDGKETISYVAYTRSTISNALLAKFIIEHPSKEVRTANPSAFATEALTSGGVKVPADLVVLQVDSTKVSAEDNLWFYNSAEGQYKKITKQNAKIANLLLLQNLAGARLYRKGMAFFSAPIYHWGWYRTATQKESGAQQKANPNYGKPIAEWNWKEMETGDFGIVRNHVYTMKIGEISGLANGIKDPDEPIVPPADNVKYNVHFHVNIQKWAVLPVQEWDWK